MAITLRKWLKHYSRMAIKLKVCTEADPEGAIANAEHLAGGGNTFHLLAQLQRLRLIRYRAAVATGVPYIGVLARISPD